MAEVKMKTAEEYSKHFCELMNKDDDLTFFANKKLAEHITKAARGIFKAKQTDDVKAGSKAITDEVGEIMSFIAFMYAKAREKEDSL